MVTLPILDLDDLNSSHLIEDMMMNTIILVCGDTFIICMTDGFYPWKKAFDEVQRNIDNNFLNLRSSGRLQLGPGGCVA